MPGTWDDGEEGDDAPSSPPAHPDDRLWRHPSELAWGRPEAEPTAPPPTGTAAPRLWPIALTSGLTGAALAVGIVALVAGLGPGSAERVVERVGVRDQLVDPLAAAPATGLDELAAGVSRSVVRIETEGVAGSGVVLLDDGHIVTNAHVVGEARTVNVVLADGTTIVAEVVGTDPVTDLAVVAADPDAGVSWVPAVRGPAGDVAVGQPAVAVGAPDGGGSPSLALGVIAALERRLSTSAGTTLHGLIQTDFAVASDASGGALSDRTGRVVGITTDASVDESEGGGPTGFATPMEAAWAIAESLMEDGVVDHVWFGIEGSDLDATASSVAGIAGRAGGVVVERVVEAGPAAAAGLRAGDVVVAVGGEAVATMSDLVMALRAHRPGDVVAVDVHRDGAIVALAVTLAERGS